MRRYTLRVCLDYLGNFVMNTGELLMMISRKKYIEWRDKLLSLKIKLLTLPIRLGILKDLIKVKLKRTYDIWRTDD